MIETEINLSKWHRAGSYKLFRGFKAPHFSVTFRLDVSRVVAAKSQGLSPFRACLYSIAKGFHEIADLRTRFVPDGRVVQYDRLTLSHTIGMADGSFGYCYVEYDPDWEAFDAASKSEIEEVRGGSVRKANLGTRADMIYLSCLPWLDFTSMTNAMPGPDDCIPRLSWGRFVTGPDGRTTCAFCAEIHHATADGAHVGAAAKVIQDTLDGF